MAYFIRLFGKGFPILIRPQRYMNPLSSKIPPGRLSLFLKSIQPLEIKIDDQLFDRLHRYVTRQLEGELYRELDPDLALMLDRDPALSEAYAALYDLEEAARSESFLTEAPEAVPRPDLSFIGSRPKADLIGIVADHIRRAGREISVRLSAELMAIFPPSPALAAGLRQAEPERFGEKLLILEGQSLPEPQPLTLIVYADREQPGSVLVEVEVSLPDRVWPDLEGVAVTINVGERVEEVETDPWGIAVFDNVPRNLLDNVVVRITFPD